MKEHAPFSPLVSETRMRDADQSHSETSSPVKPAEIGNPHVTHRQGNEDVTVAPGFGDGLGHSSG